MIVGYAYVVADIIHFGHTLHLRNCRALCDKLIVGVLTDNACMEKKPKPIIPFKERLEIVGELKSVDVVVAQETYMPDGNVAIIKPDILFESTSHFKPSKNPFGKTKVMPYFPCQSSSHIKNLVKLSDGGSKNDKS